MKLLVILELVSLLFITISIYLVKGYFSLPDIEIVLMYSLFSTGMLLYIRPAYHDKKYSFKRRQSDP
jgi:hypothetical protein